MIDKCSGSGRSPDRWPRWGENGRRPCPVCGRVVPVYMRRYDHNHRASDLLVGDHEALSFWDVGL